MHQGVKTRHAFGHRLQWIVFLRASAVSQKTPDWLRIGRFRGTSLHTATWLALPSYWKLSEHLQQVNADVLLQAAQVPDFLYALSPAARRSGVAVVYGTWISLPIQRAWADFQQKFTASV